MKTAILHYSVPPVVGGVESVIHAHTGLLLKAGHQVTLVAGVGNPAALPQGVQFIHIPEMDSRHPEVMEISQQLERGQVPGDFESFAGKLEPQLESALKGAEHVVIHNIFTKHFNLPLTVALMRLLDQGKVKSPIAWCHDISWTSPHSHPSVHPGYPWDLLRTKRDDVTYVAVSQQRQAELAELFACPSEQIKVISNGVDPVELFSLSDEGKALIEKLHLYETDIVLIMPVRITQAKNIEFALQVIANLKARGNHVKLIVTGPPDPHDSSEMEYYQHLQVMRQELGLYDEMHFVYEYGENADEGYTIGMPVLRELYRACDALFMPSHREGFGMPILEAGLIGMPIFSTEIPAVEEIGNSDINRFSHDTPAEKVAQLILDWAEASQTQKLRQRVRQNYTWQAIFKNDILPLFT